MNELKILITASTSAATKAIKEVKDEIDKVNKSATSNGKSISDSMKTIAKGAAIAVGAISAITGAMAALGKSAQEVNKGLEKLNTTFKSAGSSSAQATDTYKNLFGILGDHDRAIETAQSLARVTTEADKLNEYYTILAGSAAEYGEGLSPETLSENIAETIAQGKAMGDLARVLVEAGISEDGFNNSLTQTANLGEREVMVRSALNQALGKSGAMYMIANQATIRYNQSQANLNLTLATATKYTTPLLTALNNLGSTLLTFLAPALQTVATYLTAFIQLISAAIQWVGSFFGMFSSKTSKTTSDVAGYKNAMNNYLRSLSGGFESTGAGIDSNISKLKELKKQTMGFDELNVVSKQDTSATGGGGGGISAGSIPMAPNPADFGIGEMDVDFSQMLEDIEEAKEKIKGLGVLIGTIGAAFGLWKLANFTTSIMDSIKGVKTLKRMSKEAIEEALDAGGLSQWEAESYTHLQRVSSVLKTVLGYALSIGGAIALLYGYTDAWANGVDWGNLALMIGGVAAVVGGLALAFPGVITQFKLFGSTVSLTLAQIALFTAGIALMVVGVKDFISNGPTLQNTILIIGGAIATAVALATAGLSVLISAIVAAVAAVAAFTAAILLEESAIKSVEEAQEALNEAKEKAAEAELSHMNAVDSAEAALRRLEEAEKAAGVTGEELYNQVQNGTITYEEMDAAQREVYKAYLDNEKKQKDLKKATEELTAAKKAETIASFENQLALAKESGNYDDYKKSVIEAYENGTLSAKEARDLIGKSMSEMSTDAQKAFMEDIPGDIKKGLDPNQYETVRKKFGDFFSGIWKGITEGYDKYIAPMFTKKFWTDTFDTIKQGAKSALNGVIGIVEKCINWIVDKLNKLSFNVPDWVPGIGGKKFGFNLSKISIPRLAEGGIVTGSILANIGERGREAVLPLENNTEWMDALADRIAARNNNPTKVILKVGEKELGWATIGAINGITEQTGGLQLAL